MDLFGFKEHDEKHDETERQLRRLIEQVAQLTINLGVTRTDLRRLALQMEGKVAQEDVDPIIISINEGIKDARSALSEAQSSAEETWAEANEHLTESIDSLRGELDKADA